MRYARSIAVPCLALAVLAGAGLAGCADFPQRTAPSASERAAIDQVVRQVVAAQQLLASPGNGDLLLRSVRIDGVASLLVPGAEAERLVAGDSSALSGCVSASPATVSFTACAVGGHMFDGSVARAGSGLRSEISDVFTTADGREGTVTLEGSLSLRGGLADGSLELYAVWTRRDGSEGLLDATVSSSQLALSRSGCPIGGSLQIAGSLGDALSYAPVSRTVSFGPECGDVAITP